jgi:cyclophilin family peptidyl-prolyl cis-trans isomerase
MPWLAHGDARPRTATRALVRTAPAVLLVAACAGAGARAVAPTAGGNPDRPGLPPVTRHVEARLLVAADARRADIALLDSLLVSGRGSRDDSARRTRAALQVGQLRVRSHYPVLHSALASPDTGLAATAAFALGVARDSTAVSALEAALRRDAVTVAAEAAWALGQLGEPARSALEAMLAGDAPTPSAPDPVVFAAVIRAAGSLRPVPVALVVPQLDAAHHDVSTAAAWVLARARAAAGARALLDHARHPLPAVRAQIAAGATPSLVGDSLADAARTALRTLAVDPVLDVRVQAIRSLGALLDDRDTLPGALSPEGQRLLEALGDEAGPVRVTAAEVVAPVLGASPERWAEAVASDSGYPVQRALFDAAARRGLLTPAQHTEWRAHADPWRRVAALEHTVVDPAAPLTSVAWAWEDPSPRVRAAAVSRLAAVATQPEVREVLRGRTADSAPTVRLAALGVLAARAPVAGDLPVITRALDVPAADPMEVAVRSAALRLLAALWRNDSLGLAAADRERVRGLPLPDDPAAARLIRAVTPLASWADSVAARAPLTFEAYERLADATFGPPGAPLPIARLHTDRGIITLALATRDAPLTVHNFITLARQGWFDGTRFHRVIAGFVAQDGDPTGTGSGGPGYSIRDELNRHRYARGAVGMALSGPDSGGSQFFLTLTPQPHLDGGYTVFAHVIEGQDVMDGLRLGDRLQRVEVP